MGNFHFGLTVICSINQAHICYALKFSPGWHLKEKHTITLHVIVLIMFYTAWSDN